jgi:hypothetical protein
MESVPAGASLKTHFCHSATSLGGEAGTKVVQDGVDAFKLLTVNQLKWCGRGDLNPHALRRHPLKMVCLPIPPLPQGLDYWPGGLAGAAGASPLGG